MDQSGPQNDEPQNDEPQNNEPPNQDSAPVGSSNRGMPPGTRPILVGAIITFLWFTVLSSLVSAPFGPQLSPTVIDRGTAQVTGCQRSWRTLWAMWECPAIVGWEKHELASETVLSPDRLSGTVPVVARSVIRRGRTPQASDFGDRAAVVPASMPANTALSVAQLTLINVGAMVVLWGVVIAMVSSTPKRSRVHRRRR